MAYWSTAYWANFRDTGAYWKTAFWYAKTADWHDGIGVAGVWIQPVFDTKPKEEIELGSSDEEEEPTPVAVEIKYPDTKPLSERAKALYKLKQQILGVLTDLQEELNRAKQQEELYNKLLLLDLIRKQRLYDMYLRAVERALRILADEMIFVVLDKK